MRLSGKNRVGAVLALTALIVLTSVTARADETPAAPAPGSEQEQAIRTRGFFLIPLIITTIVSTLVGDGTHMTLNAAMNGKTQQQPQQLQPSTTDQAAQPQSDSSATPNTVPAGIVYQIFRHDPGSKLDNAVDPQAYTFSTGDRFFVMFMTNLPGQAVAYNVDPGGNISELAHGTVTGGDIVRLPQTGFFAFTGEPGAEFLQIQLRPCLGGEAEQTQAQAAGAQIVSRKIVYVRDEVAKVLPSCSAKLASGPQAVRALTVHRDGYTGLAVDQVSVDQFAGGNAVTESISIRLQHAN